MEKGGGSRLLQMQARFQQKQMQEREMKIASLYEAQQTRALDKVRHSPSSNGHVSNGHGAINSPPQPPVPHQPGKVRQMFEERRTKGIDKSYPLQPIHNTERTRKALPNGYTKVTATTTNARVTMEKQTTKTNSTISSHSVKKVHHKTNSIVNGAGDLNHNHEVDQNSFKHGLPQSNGEHMPADDEVDKPDNDNNYLLEDETFPDALAPIPTPQSPEPRSLEPVQPRQEPKAPPRRSPATKASLATKASSATKASPATKTSSATKARPTSPVKPLPHAATPSRRVTSEITGPASRNHPAAKSPRAAAAAGPKLRSNLASPSTAAAPAQGSGDACAVCGRRFAPDRLAKHQDICKKAHAKKRKPFDVLKHRLAGTEAEPFINKLRKGVNQSTTKVQSKPLNSTWRQKHEEFINAIRAAKQVQAHLQAGGKLSDLPPPPPSENPDYVQCPSCGRRFNQGAAERHIPKCKDFQFNKPKPTASRRR